MSAAPKQVESIPAVTAPVKLPRLVPSETPLWANVIGAGVPGVVAAVLLVVGLVQL